VRTEFFNLMRLSLIRLKVTRGLSARKGKAFPHCGAAEPRNADG
jgi:hypothetical protein